MPHLHPALRILPVLVLTVLSPTQASQSIPSATLSRDTAIMLLQEDPSSLVVYRDQQTGIPNFLAGALPDIIADVGTPIEAARVLR
jgi:hypothetical protein